MRVAIDYTAAINQHAGIGRFVRSLVGALAELDGENQYLLLHARPNPGALVRFPAGANFLRRRLPLPQRYLDLAWQRIGLPLPVNLITGPIDLYHAPDFVLPPVRRARTLVTIHDLAFLLHPECADARLGAYLEKTVPRSVTRADFVLADSENTRNDLICLLGADPKRVAVVPGGVEPFFQPVEDPIRLTELRQRLGLGEAPFILAVGMIEPRKNLTVLFEAYRLLRERRKLPHRLVVAGRRGWLWEDTVDRAERSPYRDDILFVGYVPDEDLPTLYSAAAVYAFPSLYEGFGLMALEAMACGTPLVASRTSSLPEVVGEAGLLVDPRDADELAAALELAILDEPLRATLRRRGLERAATFTWQASAEKLLAVYKKLSCG